jgi:hypothetical protein
MILLEQDVYKSSTMLMHIMIFTWMILLEQDVDTSSTMLMHIMHDLLLE